MYRPIRALAVAFRLAFALLLVALPAAAQTDLTKTKIETTELASGVYMLKGAGGHIGVSVGDDGVMLIDDQVAELSDKIKFAVRQITEKPIVFVLNTHWHGDHTGGNENFGAEGIWILAHDNVRTRLGADQFQALWNRTIPARPAAMPVVTFSEDMSFHINDQDIHVFHVENAHTDGDVVVHFQNRNVIHAGDVFWNRRYPIIDVDTGGNARGMLRAATRILTLTDGGTKIIAGHGEVGSRDDVRAFRDMMQAAVTRVEKLVGEGKTLDQVLDAKLMADHDAAWGGGPIDTKRFVQMVYLSLKP
jgi:glyoxylase-like metal-dependent hydrolase (beta-lactamase superfamily II)